MYSRYVQQISSVRAVEENLQCTHCFAKHPFLCNSASKLMQIIMHKCTGDGKMTPCFTNHDLDTTTLATPEHNRNMLEINASTKQGTSLSCTAAAAVTIPCSCTQVLGQGRAAATPIPTSIKVPCTPTATLPVQKIYWRCQRYFNLGQRLVMTAVVYTGTISDGCTYG